jgi:uncharacterized protein
MAVRAGVSSVVNKVKAYEEDLSKKLPIIQGNQRERQVFDQIKRSLPSGDFQEIEGSSPQQTIDAMNSKIPVIAQGYFTNEVSGYEWSGYADLLVLEGYEISQSEDGAILASKVREVPDEPKYTPWDVKNSSEGKPKYQVQLASYLQALIELGLASESPMGIVLGFKKGITKYDSADSLELYREAVSSLVSVLDKTTPKSIEEDFIDKWSCVKKSTCGQVYCDYPGLCKMVFREDRVLELLPRMHHTHSPKIRSAGFDDFTSIARSETLPVIDGLRPELVERYWLAAKVMEQEFQGQLTIMSKIDGQPVLPNPTHMDLFFDIEWFNPVDASEEFIFMLGVVGSDESFKVFVSERKNQELEQLDKFLDFSLERLNLEPDMHVYHFSDPEPKKLEELSKRYGGHRHSEVATLISRMVDLREIAEESFVPGSGSYSIKSLENYYDADSKLHRGGLVLGGADAMYQFELFRVEQDEKGNSESALEIMKGITDYNKDDCLSTKLLYDWLSQLNFDSAGQMVTIPKRASR